MVKKGKKTYYVFPDPAHNQALRRWTQSVPGLPTASRRQEARQGRSPGRGDVSGRRRCGVEYVGGWRWSLGTHGRTGTILKN